MAKRVNNFVSKVRESNESTKKVWSFALSAISTVAILGAWVLYGQILGDSGVVSLAQADNPSESSELEARAASLGATVRGIFKTFRETTGAEYDIEAKDNNFIYDDLDPISPTSLP